MKCVRQTPKVNHAAKEGFREQGHAVRLTVPASVEDAGWRMDQLSEVV